MRKGNLFEMIALSYSASCMRSRIRISTARLTSAPLKPKLRRRVVLNLQASLGRPLAGKETFLRSSAGPALGKLGDSWSDAARVLHLIGMKMSFEGTHGFSSLERLSAMFSNTASIFAIASAFADGWGGAIGNRTFEDFDSFTSDLKTLLPSAGGVNHHQVKISTHQPPAHLQIEFVHKAIYIAALNQAH